MIRGKILVTGGTGFIGSHTVCQLLDRGLDVVSIDNLSNSYEDVNERIKEISGKNFQFIKTDMCEKSQLEAVFQSNPDIIGVIHFAAFKSVGESVQNPLLYYNNNLNSLIHLLEISNKYQVNHLVFSSSCTVYGQPARLPVSETSPVQQPWSPYGNTKKICEEILRDTISCFNDLSVIALRYFNPVGAHPSGKIGELPIGIPNNLMPYITQTAFGVRKQLQIFGGDYNTPDGTAIRDYIHVVDLADAHLVALERMLNKKMKNRYEIFNLGNGRGYSVLEVVNTFKTVTGVDLPYRITERRQGDIEQIWADPTLANQELGWKSQRTLEDMLADSWKWENYYRNDVKNKYNHE